MSKGIKETKQLLGFILSLSNAIGSSLEDGKFSAKDLLNFFDSMRMAADALEGIGDVGGELSDLDEKEQQELLNYAVNKFDIPQKTVERYVELGLKGGLAIVSLIQNLRSESEDEEAS